MRVEFQIEGARELERLIASMPAKLAKKGLRRAVRTAHRVIYESIVRRIAALPDSGRLDRRSLKLAMLMSFRVRAPRRQKAGTYSMDAVFVDSEAAGLVYYRQGAHSKVAFNAKDRHGNLVDIRGGEVGRTFVPFALEYGHGSNKAAAARPFMRPGVEAAQTEAARTLATQTAHELDKLVRESGGRAG